MNFLMLLSLSLYVLGNLLTNVVAGKFLFSSARLSTRLDNDKGICLKLSINFSWYAIGFLLAPVFLKIHIEKVMYFSVFSPKQLKGPSKSWANYLIIKWKSYLETLWNTTGILLGTLYCILQALWAAPLYLPV